MFPLARNESLSVRKLADETMIYDERNHKAHCLNAAAYQVWQHCDGQTDLAGLAEVLQRELGIADGQPAVELALEQLGRRQLLAYPGGAFSFQGRRSRREVLKKLAALSATLPVIMTLTANRAHAQLSQVCTGVCNNNLPCSQPGCNCVKSNPNNQFGQCFGTPRKS